MRYSSVTPASIGVSMMPGAMVLTRMPNCARSRAAGTVMPCTPPLDAEYAIWPIWPMSLLLRNADNQCVALPASATQGSSPDTTAAAL